VERGNHQQLLEKGGIYAKLVEKQIQKLQNTLEEGKDIKKQKQQDDVIDNLMKKES
jgi:hypothetical protein